MISFGRTGRSRLWDHGTWIFLGIHPGPALTVAGNQCILIDVDRAVTREYPAKFKYRGGVAQWSECLPVTQEAAGSSPVIPVIEPRG